MLHSMITRLRPQWTLTIIPGSVDEAVAWFKDNPQPDLIFLDIQLADGNAFDYIIDLSLNKLMEQLDPEQFFRANRQIIISIASIDHAEPYFNGKIVVSVLPPYKAQITISEEKLSSFKLWLNY